MEEVKIWHNSRCSKSRQGLAILEQGKEEFEVFNYLKEELNKEDLKSVLGKLNIKAEDLIRKSEAVYKELYKGKSMNTDQWIDAMLKHPKLIERPIIIKGKTAIIGRPPEIIKDFLTS